jgi:hypothetical protein
VVAPLEDVGGAKQEMSITKPRIIGGSIGHQFQLKS